MEILKPYIEVAGIVFMAGMLYQLIKVLKDNLKEVKENQHLLQQLVQAHDTRITVLEALTGKRRKGDL